MLERFEEILAFALASNATDIHFELNNDKKIPTISIRTIDGFMTHKSVEHDRRLMEYLKYKGNLDLIQSKHPQSGSFTYVFDEVQYYFRIAVLKSQFLEVCVVRILNTFYVDERIFDSIKDELTYVLKQTHGLIIFSGPTGSGKTTSMYTLMQMYKGKKIYSIEDPIEIYFDSIVQVNVNNNRNFGYKEAITQILRHDPDIICIGEIRDEQAAQMAIRAAFTGHLVICTVHATNCEMTIQRLLDLNVSEQDLKDNLLMIANQRLNIVENERVSVYETIVY